MLRTSMLGETRLVPHTFSTSAAKCNLLLFMFSYTVFWQVYLSSQCTEGTINPPLDHTSSTSIGKCDVSSSCLEIVTYLHHVGEQLEVQQAQLWKAQ